jgi:hypothetical protein
MNFNEHTVTWDTDTIPMKDRDTCNLSSLEALIEVYMSANEPQTLTGEYSWDSEILDAEYKPVSLDDVIRTLEYLAYWIIRQAIQPIRNKIDMNAILNIKVLKTRKSQQTTPVYWYSKLLSQHVVLQKRASV